MTLAIYERDEYSEKHLAGPGFWFGLSWVIATVAAVVVGDALASWIQLLSGPTGFGGVVVAALVGLTVGLCMAVAQAIVLLPYFRTAGALQWIGATVLGCIMRMLMITLLSYTLLAIIPTEAPGVLFLGVIAAYFGAMAVIGAIAGAATGYAQHLVLKRRVVQARRWVGINIIASASVFIAIAAINFHSMVSVVLPPIPDDGDYLSIGHRPGYTYMPPLERGLLFDIITGAVAAAITGFVLIDMLRHPTPQAEWSTRLKDEHEHLSKGVIEAQPSPEALLKAQQRRGSE